LANELNVLKATDVLLSARVQRQKLEHQIECENHTEMEIKIGFLVFLSLSFS